MLQHEPPLAGVGQKLLRQVRCPLARMHHVLQPFAYRPRRKIADRHAGIAEDAGEQIIEIVRHPARQPPHALELLRLPELLLQPLPLRDVADQVNRALHLPAVEHGVHRHVIPALAAAHIHLLAPPRLLRAKECEPSLRFFLIRPQPVAVAARQFVRRDPQHALHAVVPPEQAAFRIHQRNAVADRVEGALPLAGQHARGVFGLPCAQGGVDGGDEHLRLHRFRQVALRAAVETLHLVALPNGGRAHVHYRNARRGRYPPSGAGTPRTRSGREG